MNTASQVRATHSERTDQAAGSNDHEVSCEHRVCAICYRLQILPEKQCWIALYDALLAQVRRISPASAPFIQSQGWGSTFGR